MIECFVFTEFTGGAGVANNGEKLTPDVLAAHAAALEEQLNGPYADAWDSAEVTCRVGAPNGADVGPTELAMCYFQTSDQAGAAGYHTTTPTGQPYAKVFLEDAETMSTGPQAASVIASHEGLETMGDPAGNLLALRNDFQTFDVRELCDAVEDTTYTASNGVQVSNFLLQSAFDPGAAGPYDKLGVLQTPYATTPGGYRMTGTAIVDDSGQARMKFQAVGDGLKDSKKLARKKREHARAALRGAVEFPE